MLDKKKDEEYMKIALEEAKKAYKIKEIPVGAIIVKNNKIIASGFNKREKKNNAIAHAEIIAIDSACRKLKSWRLLNTTIYVTLEPCIMCAGAIVNSKIKRLVFGTKSDKINIFNYKKFFDELYNKEKIEIISGVCENECKNLLQKFFKKLR